MNSALKSGVSATDLTKYSNPIPSRSYILEQLKRHNNALNRKQIENLLSLSGAEEREALRRRLRAMERDGQIAFDPRRGYSILDDQDLVMGRVIGHPDGFGFLACDNTDADLLLNKRDMLQLFDGDCVRVKKSGVDHRGRQKATLVNVVERNTDEVVGTLGVDNGNYYVRPQNSRITHDIDIDNQQLMGASIGEYVVVRITEYPCSQFNAFGEVSEVLGKAMAPGMEIEVAIREYGIPHQWSKDIMRATKAFGKDVEEDDKCHRVDLRTLPFVTIDGNDAKDFDDAVYCEEVKNGWRLWVAIADVSHYVKPKTSLDEEAKERATSVYFPGKVIPMLPEALSNGLCSLKPKVDRLAVVCEMRINAKGKMTGYQFSEAVIHSHGRLTYDEVNAMITTSTFGDSHKQRDGHVALSPHILSLHRLYGALRTARDKRGSIDFESQEVSFQFSTQRKIEQIHPVIRNDAHKLIEECMLCANVAAARFLESSKLPALYRTHAGPEQEKLTTFRRFLKEKGYSLAGGSKPSPAHFGQLLDSIEGEQESAAVQSMMLRTFGQAEYSPESLGHFGLAFSSYTHFTSPIRRYADLLIHRAIKSVIRRPESTGFIGRTVKRLTGRGGDSVKRIESAEVLDASISYPYGSEEISFLAGHCSQRSRRADKASRDVDAWLKCEYMTDAVGKRFDGVISTVTHFGVFVELNDTKIEGLVHLSGLNGDYYQFDSLNQCLVGDASKRQYATGDKIRVRVESVDMEQKKIAFTLDADTA